jgi:hypothetical protein
MMGCADPLEFRFKERFGCPSSCIDLDFLGDKTHPLGYRSLLEK